MLKSGKFPYSRQPLLFAGLALTAVGLPLSLFLTSVSQFVLAGSFFVEGKPLEKARRFFGNPIALLAAGFWLLHAAGLLWTTDLSEGWKDLRIKLPLLVLPVVLAGSHSLSRSEFRTLLRLFVTAVVTASVIHTLVLTGIIPWEIRDVRDIFIFKISHIRFALFTCLSIGICLWEFRSASDAMTAKGKLVWPLCALWLLMFLVISESVTGLAILTFLSLGGILYSLLRSQRIAFRAAGWLLAMLIPVTFLYILNTAKKQLAEQPVFEYSFADTTAEGNHYFFDIEHVGFENGHPVWVYVCDSELVREWRLVSRVPYDSLDEKGQPVRYTLIRYLASKGLRKDAKGFGELSNDEIRSIERGIANAEFSRTPGIKKRFKEVAWEFEQYREGADPSGHSVTQRLEFWKAALLIIGQHPIAGVGPGDMPDAFRTMYDSMNSRLQPEFRLRSHNQFLAITVALGLIGLIYFLLVLMYPFQYAEHRKEFLFVVFWLIFFLSLFTEDTLETQPGATFFALFYSLLLFSKPSNNAELPEYDVTN